MRVLLALLLCFTLAFQGNVNAQAFSTPCPMGHDGGPSASAHEMVQAEGDCCNDADTAAKTGQLCKTDMPCGTSSAFGLPSFHAHVPSAQASAPVPALTAPIAASDPSGVWRPPTLS